MGNNRRVLTITSYIFVSHHKPEFKLHAFYSERNFLKGRGVLLLMFILLIIRYITM